MAIQFAKRSPAAPSAPAPAAPAVRTLADIEADIARIERERTAAAARLADAEAAMSAALLADTSIDALAASAAADGARVRAANTALATLQAERTAAIERELISDYEAQVTAYAAQLAQFRAFIAKGAALDKAYETYKKLDGQRRQLELDVESRAMTLVHWPMDTAQARGIHLSANAQQAIQALRQRLSSGE